MGVDIGALAFLGVGGAQGHQGTNRLQHRIGPHADPKDGEAGGLDPDPELAESARNQAIGTGRIEDLQGKDPGEQGAQQAGHSMDRQDIKGVIQAQAVLGLQGAIADHGCRKANPHRRQGIHVASCRGHRHQPSDGTCGGHARGQLHHQTPAKSIAPGHRRQGTRPGPKPAGPATWSPGTCGRSHRKSCWYRIALPPTKWGAFIEPGGGNTLQSPTVLTTLLILLVGLALARLSAGKLAGWAVPAIVVELLIGFGLGNSVLPYAAIKPLSGLTELGVLALFFQVGLEVRGDLLLSRRGTILRLVALSCLAPLLGYWPLTLGFSMAPATALLCLACVAATGTGVTLRLLAQRGALHSPSGRLLVGVSVLDDLPAIGLLGLSVTLGGSNSTSGPGLIGLVLALGAAVASFVLAGLWRQRGGPAPSSPLTVLILLIGSAWVGEASGLTSLLGALWGGVLFNRLNPGSQGLGGLLTVLSEVFLPLYFISVGMRIQASTLLQSQAWGLALFLLALAVVSKLLCGLGVSANDRRAGIDRWQVIYGLMPRGLPGLVFASTALAAGVINAVQFSALVLMVSCTTVVGLVLLERRLQAQQQPPGAGGGG